jgi:SAM-dependent methyltransferase
MIATSEWNDRPFRGAAPYYVRGRLPYAASLADTLAQALGLDGGGRLLDIGCGPGVVALRLAHLFEEVVGLDIDPDMLAEADGSAQEQGLTRANWVCARAEDLPVAFGMFRVATFGRSFHWMDHERLAPAMFDVLESGGAFVVLFETGEGQPDPDRPLPHPLPPRAAIEELLQRYLGATARWSGHDRRFAMLQDVPPILARVGFVGPEQIRAESRELFVRTADDVIAFYYSRSSSAPSLFGDRLAKFEADFRRVLGEASPSELFSELSRDTEVLVWRKPGR